MMKPLVQCPSGHPLVDFNALEPGICSGCGKLVERGQHMMDCRQCRWGLCGGCFREKVNSRLLLLIDPAESLYGDSALKAGHCQEEDLPLFPHALEAFHEAVRSQKASAMRHAKENNQNLNIEDSELGWEGTEVSV